MKTKYLIFAALAGMTLASCSNGEFLGDNNSPTLAEESTGDAIQFSYTMQNATRADKYKYDADAATKLGNKFVIYGTKHASAEDKTADNDKVVFNNFQIAWTTSTAGKTASNASGWEYAGLQSYDPTPTQQSVKYWDYSSAGGYTFYAFSSTDITYPKNASDKVQVTKVTSDGTSLYNKGYQVEVDADATLNNLYFSDRVEIPKTKFGGTVSFTFRNLGAKARFGFYETVPGYSVKIDKFYIDEDANPEATPTPTAPVVDFAKMRDYKTDGFYASLQNVKMVDDQTVNVTYYDNSDAKIENRPKVTQPTKGYNYTFKQGDGTGLINTVLSTSAANPTWAATGDGYTPVIPFEGNTNPLLVKLDFTLTSEDGNGDVIHVRGARAIVPASCVQWKSNFAYTYIFKISDQTNGTTGDVDDNGDPKDPEGLKPITFDAIVVDVDNEMQQTITTVSTNSITTYAEGAITNEYTNGKPIYAVVSDKTDHSLITPTGIGTAATEAQVYKLSEATTEASVLAKLNGSPMSFTMTATTGGEAASIETTIPLSDGTTPAISNVKFTPSAAGTYAYVYTTTAYVAPTYTVQSAGTYDSGKTYYMKTGAVYYAVTVPSEAAFAEHKDHLYLASGGTTGVYDVKVIKVQ